MSIALDSFNVPKFSIYQCLQAKVALCYIRKQQTHHKGLFSPEFSHRSWLIGSDRYSCSSATVFFMFVAGSNWPFKNGRCKDTKGVRWGMWDNYIVDGSKLLFQSSGALSPLTGHVPWGGSEHAPPHVGIIHHTRETTGVLKISHKGKTILQYSQV